MKQGKILYEPLPIGRMGVRRDNQEVIIANDYSCFAQMIEEYISYGAIKIVITQSAPEVKTLEQMPLILKNRIVIIDDSAEIETQYRLLHRLRKEFNVRINEENSYLIYPNNTDRKLITSVDRVHSDLKKIALGFNHNIQADINTESSIKNLRFLRENINDFNSRIILAELEAFFSQYKKLDFEAITPPSKDTPAELIVLFDKLINDKNYLEYSDMVSQLGTPQVRDEALIKIRELLRLMRSKNYLAEGWNYVSKILQVWTGLPIPESKVISNLFNDRSLPSFVNLDTARTRAIEMWRNSKLTTMPLRRDGLPISNENITWLPPLHSMEVRTSNDGHSSLGTVGELIEVLQSVREQTASIVDQPNAPAV